MPQILDIKDFPTMSTVDTSYHGINIKAHHVEMENVLGDNWEPSEDNKCQTIWNAVFRDDNGECFPFYVYDYEEYDSYFTHTNHQYHIGTHTADQSRIVAEYLECQLTDFYVKYKQLFSVDKASMTLKIENAILSYCYLNDTAREPAHLGNIVIQIRPDLSIEIGTPEIIRTKYFSEYVHFLMFHDGSEGKYLCDRKKIERIIDQMPGYFYYQHLNSIQRNRIK